MKLVLFDFDETLIKENSLASLFKASVGHNNLIFLALPALFSKVALRYGVRFAVKQRLYRKCLCGMDSAQLYEFGLELAKRFTPNLDVVNTLREQHDLGNKIWIVTASPRSYIQGICDGLNWPYALVIGTELPESNGKLTGELGVECSRAEKVIRIHQTLMNEGITLPMSSAYGNLPADGPMLQMADEGFIVRDGETVPFVVNKHGFF